jgi:hypothetical protein
LLIRANRAVSNNARTLSPKAATIDGYDIRLSDTSFDTSSGFSIEAKQSRGRITLKNSISGSVDVRMRSALCDKVAPLIIFGAGLGYRACARVM